MMTSYIFDQIQVCRIFMQNLDPALLHTCKHFSVISHQETEPRKDSVSSDVSYTHLLKVCNCDLMVTVFYSLFSIWGAHVSNLFLNPNH